jgi:hypothetical protein
VSIAKETESRLKMLKAPPVSCDKEVVSIAPPTTEGKEIARRLMLIDCRRSKACCSTKEKGSDESPSLNNSTVACPPRYPALATNTDSRTCCSVAPVADARVLLYTIDSSAAITAARDVPAFRFTIVSGVPLSSVTATRTRPSSTGRLSTVATATSIMSRNTVDDTLPDASTMMTTSCNKKLQNGATGVTVGATDCDTVAA